MKITRSHWIMFGVICVLLFFLWDATCGSDIAGENIEVKTPEKTGKFEAAKPEMKPIVEKVIEYRDNPNQKLAPEGENDTVNERLLIENVILSLKFKNATDSLKLAKYDKAIEVIDFSKTFENDTIKIEAFGKARGTVEKLGVNWKIKPSTQKVNVKTWRILATGEVGTNTIFHKHLL